MRLAVLLGMLLVAGTASAGNIQGQLDSDTTWTPAGNPHTLTGDVVVPAGVTLTIQPGVVVIAAATDGASGGTDKYRVELIVRGTLRVLGTGSKPVTFRAASAGDGNWQGVRVEAGTSSMLSSAIIRDARTGLEVSGAGTSVTVTASTLTDNLYGALVSHDGTLAVDHTLVSSNTWSGIALADGNATILHNTFVYNPIGLDINNVSGSYNITVQDSIIVGQNSYSGYNSYGIRRTNSFSDTLTLSHNNVWNNSTANYSNVLEGPDSFSANPLFVAYNDFRITSASPARHAASDGSDLGALPFSGEPTPNLQGTLYEDTTLSGYNTLYGDLLVPPGVTLTIAPGSTILANKGDGMGSGADPSKAEIIVRGTLRVMGTRTSPVTLMYDTYSSGGSGYWRGVRVEAGTRSTLSHVIIRHADYALDVSGSGTSATLSSGVLTVNGTGASARAGGTLVMDHTLVHSNSNAGVSITNANASLLHNTIASNGAYGINITHSTSGNTVEVRNSIVTNHSFGINRTSGAGVVTLSHNDVWNHSGGNYFGVTEGPNSFSSNPLFVSSWDYYYHLKASSPCRGAGEGGSDIG
ncbi:right-handed parallel beta-helix repeat-containing protein, partial [Archangium sp.]|uniref:right-handed parallel beta-helix repeat-containing protein n=1 Tax=Archangium sp. TaxID=1872627 RepID=UPI002ED93710